MEGSHSTRLKSNHAFAAERKRRAPAEKRRYVKEIYEIYPSVFYWIDCCSVNCIRFLDDETKI